MFWSNFFSGFSLLRACLEKNKRLHRENRLLKKMLREQENLLHEQQKLMELKLEEALESSKTDALTGAFNGHYLPEVMPLFLSQARNEKFLAVLSVDLDNFKTVNDTCGHIAGDETLVKAYIAFKKTVRESDVVIRIGGDEFLIIATNVDDKESLLILAERLHNAVKEIIVENCPISIGVSIGICFVRKNGNKMAYTFDEARELSDKAMYTSKALKGTTKIRITLVEGWDDFNES